MAHKSRGQARSALVRADKLRTEGRLDEAERLLRELLKGSPRNAAAWLSLAKLLAARGDFAGAERAYGEVIAVEARGPAREQNSDAQAPGEVSPEPSAKAEVSLASGAGRGAPASEPAGESEGRSPSVNHVWIDAEGTRHVFTPCLPDAAIAHGSSEPPVVLEDYAPLDAGDRSWT